MTRYPRQLPDDYDLRMWLFWMEHYGHAETGGYLWTIPTKVAECRDHKTRSGHLTGHPWDRLVLAGPEYRR